MLSNITNATLGSGDTLFGIFHEGSRGRPQWDYSELRDSGTNENLSNLAFDLLLFIGIAIVTVVSLGIKFGFKEDNVFLGKLKKKLESVESDVSREIKPRGPLSEVAHIRKDSFFVYFSVMTTIAFIVFKILTGSNEADAGQIFLILLVALFSKMLRQETTDDNTAKVLMSIVPTVFAILASYLGFIGYSKNEHFYQQDKTNSWYIACVSFGVVAMVFKTFVTIFEYGFSKDSQNKMKDDKSKSNMAGEYMYPLRLMDIIVFSFVAIFFFCFEGIVIARADTELYAVGFWALWVLPIYCILMQIFFAISYKTNVLVTIFNIVVTLHLFGIILLSQMQVCSFFTIDSDKTFTDLDGDAPVKRAPIGCPGHWGLYQHDDHKGISMHKSSIWLLGVITSLFITAVYAGATFTMYQTSERIKREAKTRV